ncbi:MAG: hypothetical protein JKY96_01195 [Phycisphaerales bacterium]|nr:hypothetical protein [Phycisphaerales bacterium]
MAMMVDRDFGYDFHQDQFSENPADDLVMWLEQDHPKIQMTNIYRNASVGLIDDNARQRILFEAIYATHFEQFVPKDGSVIRTTSLTRFLYFVLGIVGIFVGFMALAALLDFMFPAVYKTKIAPFVFRAMIFAELLWLTGAVRTYWIEATAKVAEVRKSRSMHRRLVSMIQGFDIDGQMLRNAWEHAESNGLLVTKLDQDRVLEDTVL